MSTISSMGSMPRQCSCGAWPVVEFLPHAVEWRVECPQCGKVGVGFAQIDEAVSAWNEPATLATVPFTANTGAAADLVGAGHLAH